MSLAQRAWAEFTGTAFLLAAIVGSGIMGERLSGGNAALALLANSLATGFALAALIVMLAPRSGAHLNPVITLALAWRRDFPWREVPHYAAAQVLGALVGVAAAHLMFDLPVLQVSTHARGGVAQCFSEVIASFGLAMVVLSCTRERPWEAPLAVGAYIAAAYWFTASTSFANPAVTLARSLTDTFTGIRPADVAPFIAAQLAGGAAAVPAARRLL